MKKHCVSALALLLALLLALPYSAFALENGMPQAEGALQTAGVVHVDSDPAGADVYVDGVLYAPAVTPCELPLSEGTHTLSVRIKGYDPYETAVQAGDSITAKLLPTLPAGPNVRTIVVNADDQGHPDARLMTWEFYERFVCNGEAEPEWDDAWDSGDWEDEAFLAYLNREYFYPLWAYAQFNDGVSLREAICIAENDTGWYDEDRQLRWYYDVEFSAEKDEYVQSASISCYGRSSAAYLSGEPLFYKYSSDGLVEDAAAKALWRQDGCFTVNGDRDRDGVPDVTLSGVESYGWDGRHVLNVMCSDTHVTGLRFAPTMHVAAGIPGWQPRYCYNVREISFTGCEFEGIDNGVGRFFGAGVDGIYGNGAEGYGDPGTYVLDGFTISGCKMHNDQLGIIASGGDTDYCTLKNLTIQANRVTNGTIFVRNEDAHTWYMWPNRPDMSGTENGENCIGVSEHNTTENVTISGNLVEFTGDVVDANLYDGGYGEVINVGNSNLGGSHNTLRNVVVRCNRSTVEQANVDAYQYWPNAGVSFSNADVGDGRNDGYDGDLASSLCQVSDNLFDGLTVEYNDFQITHFSVGNVSLVGTAQVGTGNVFRNIRIAHNHISTVKGLDIEGAHGSSNLGCEAEGRLEHVEISDNTLTVLRKTGWSADSNVNSSGEQDDYGIRVCAAAVADYDGSSWNESGAQQPFDGLKSAVSDVRIEGNSVKGFANGVLICAAQCDRTHYVTGVTVDNVTISDNEIVTDNRNKNCRNDGILLVGAIEGGVGCEIHRVDVRGNRVTAANGLFAAGFYFMGTHCRWGVRDNRVLHVTAEDNRFTFVDPRGCGGFPIVSADAVSGWDPIPYDLGQTAVVLVESGNTAEGFAWGAMRLAALSLFDATDDSAFLAAAQACSDEAVGKRFIDWSRDTEAAAGETPLYVGVCDRPEYRPGNCHRYYLCPSGAGVLRRTVSETPPGCTEPGERVETVCCARCSEALYSETNAAASALGHDFGAWTESAAPTCTEAGAETRTCARCGASETRPVDALGHDWGAPSYTWAEDCSEITAAHSCKRDPGHTESEKGTVTSEVTLAPTAAAEGEITYTATFTNPAFETQTKTAPIPKLDPTDPCAEGHDWDVPTYEWAEDNSTVTAMRVCRNNREHVETETVTTTSEVTLAATVDAEGEITFTATFTNPAFETQTKKVATPKLDEPGPIGNPFLDVGDGDWFKDAVLWAVSQTPPVTNGVDATHFAPTKTCTRAEVVTFLWNAAGRPTVEGVANPFLDVSAGDWFYQSVMWAVKNGITSGTDAKHFSPAKTCTRAEVVQFLRNAAGKPAPTETNNPFEDVKTSDWFFASVLWAVEQGVTAGVDAKHFAPGKTCTRAEVVQFLYKASMT